MTKTLLTCPLCGFQFDPQDHPHCISCPLNRDCHMVCCPACQYTTIDTDQSKLAQIVSHLLKQEKSGEKVSTRK